MAKKVAVIGAGPSGLVTTKELLEFGYDAICFEKSNDLGGVFRFDEESGVRWESCRLTSSGYLTVFSDFPVSEDRSEHMSADEYVRYLDEYATEFGVKQHIRFNTEIESIRQQEDGRWLLRSQKHGTASEELFDSVAVCSGLHQNPDWPDVPGLDTFTGTALHASDYRRPAQVAGKKVLIVGAGESGADIAAEVAAHAAIARLSLRRGVGVVARCHQGYPRDFLTSRLLNAPAHFLGQTRNPLDDTKRTRYRVLGAPILLVERFFLELYRFGWMRLPRILSRDREKVQLEKKASLEAQKLLKESGGNLFEQFGTKDNAFVRALAKGDLHRVQGLKKINASQVEFSDGETFEPDVIIFSTGFKTRIAFLEDEIANVPRYLNTFNPSIGASLGFIGFIRPAFGAIPPLAELQARWFVQLLEGNVQLPSEEGMHNSIEHLRKHRRHVFRAKEDRLTHLVDFTETCDELASHAGCKPTRSFVSAQGLAFRRRFYLGPMIAAQYRLQGPGAKTELARETIMRMPIVHVWPHGIHMRLRVLASKLAHRVYGDEFAPKLSLDN